MSWHPLRRLIISPSVLASVAATLALSIGAATAVFSVIDGVLLKPLPVADQDRLLVVWRTRRAVEQWPFSYTSYEAMRERLHAVSDLAAHPYAGAFPGVLRLPDGSAQSIPRAPVTGNWFGVIGVRPLVGRLLEPTDDVPGAAPVAVVSSGAAARFFGDVRAAVGGTLRIGEVSYTVVGVTPAGFDFPRTTQVWHSSAGYRTTGFVLWHLVARVAPGATVAQARADLDAALMTLPSEPETAGERIRATPFADVVVGDVRPALVVLGGVMFLMWVAASVNVVNLLVVRNLSRQRDFGVKTALGATRAQLVREAFAEALVLASIGTALGIGVTYVALPAFLMLAPPELPRMDSIAIDGRAMAFAVASGAFAVFLGTFPALHATSMEPARVLGGASRGVTGSRHHGLRNGLVVAQVAIATLVLSTASLLLRSFDLMQRADLGFAPDQIYLAEISLPIGRSADWQVAMSRLAERVAGRAGISAATAVGAQPFAGTQGADSLLFGEGQALEPRATPMVNYEGVDAHHFSTMQLPILRGRAIDGGDRAGSQRVVVINESLAQMFWPGQDAVGRRVRWEWEPTADITVVGVAADTRYREFTTPRPTVYVPYGQGIPVMPRFLAVRTSSPAGLMEVVRESIADAVPGGLVLGVTPLPGLLAAPLARPRFQSALVGAFAVLGIALAVIGAYGVTAFTVRQRTREIGIRIALGAGLGHVRWLVLRQGLVLGAAGIAMGLLASLATGRVVQPMLFDVRPSDPLALAGAAIVLILAAASATLFPMRRATRTDPMQVMRSE